MRGFISVAGFAIAIAVPIFAQFHLPGTGGKADPTPKTPKTTPSPVTVAPPVAVASAEFDYYVLALSWAPGKGVWFMVRGLIPEASEGSGKESCGPVKAVSKGVMSLVLPIMPSRTAIQQEWSKHGSCTGLSAGDYFNGIRYARSQVQIPVQFTSLEDATTESPLQIETQFAGANPGFPAGAFKTGCEGGAFTEVRVCFDLQFKPRECMASAGECGATELSVRPKQ